MREIPTRKSSLLRQAISHAEPDQRDLRPGELAAIFVGCLSLAALAAACAGWWS